MILVIQKQYLVDGGYCEWEDAFCFGTNITGCNDLFDILSTYFQKAYGSEELGVVPHMWRVYNYSTGKTLEVSGDINMIQLSDFEPKEASGIGVMPSWIEGQNRNIEVNNKLISEMIEKGLLEEIEEEDEDGEL